MSTWPVVSVVSVVAVGVAGVPRLRLVLAVWWCCWWWSECGRRLTPARRKCSSRASQQRKADREGQETTTTGGNGDNSHQNLMEHRSHCSCAYDRCFPSLSVCSFLSPVSAEKAPPADPSTSAWSRRSIQGRRPPASVQSAFDSSSRLLPLLLPLVGRRLRRDCTCMRVHARAPPTIGKRAHTERMMPSTHSDQTRSSNIIGSTPSPVCRCRSLSSAPIGWHFLAFAAPTKTTPSRVQGSPIPRPAPPSLVLVCHPSLVFSSR